MQIERLQDGTRRVTAITEVQRMEGDVITLQDLFEFHFDRVDADGRVRGGLRPTGLRPAFADKFVKHGIELPAALFTGDQATPSAAGNATAPGSASTLSARMGGATS